MSAPPELAAWLQQRSEHHSALQRQVETLAEQDPRLVAAWWFGSIGRAAADPLSDLDIWLVVDDAHLAALVEQRIAYVAQLGAPLWLLEIWSNAPDPGAYLMVNYAGPGGVYQVDWYWQGAQQARLPDDACLLFDRAGLERCPGAVTVDFARGPRIAPRPETLTGAARTDFLTQRSAFVWSMLPIIAKHIARQEDDVEHLLEMVEENLAKVAALLAATEHAPSSPPAPAPGAPFARLRAIIPAAVALWPALDEARIPVPRAFYGPLIAHLDQVERLVASGYVPGRAGPAAG
jgi:hypothetical protein